MPAVPLTPGLVLGPFTLVEKIALGGMAEIWAASHERDGERVPVALKILQPYFHGEPSFRAMFEDEVQIARRLHHPNILKVHAGYDLGGHLLQAMELLDGTDIRRLLSRLARLGQWFPAPLAFTIARDVALGLAYAHDKTNDAQEPLGIVHRDISPHNVIVTRQGGVKVLDFGIARAAERVTITRTGAVKGKLAYMAPEQALAATITPRTDMFALGVVLWEMLAMRRLFKAPSDAAVLEQVIAANVPPIRTINDVVPERAEALLSALLAKSADDRPSDMHAVAAELTDILATMYRPPDHGATALAIWVAPLLGEGRGGPSLRRPGGTAVLPADPTNDAPTIPTPTNTPAGPIPSGDTVVDATDDETVSDGGSS